MLLAVDVGNTNVKLGVYDDRSLVASWRLTTRREQTADEYGVFTHTMLRSHGLEPRQITDVAISSTVPAVQRTMEEMAGRYFELSPFVVDPGVNVALDRPEVADGCGLAWNRWLQAVQIGRHQPAPSPAGAVREIFGVSATARRARVFFRTRR